MGQCRCMALDLDGTLLDNGGRLTEEGREALTAAIDAGVHVVVASGRAYGTLPEEVLSVPGKMCIRDRPSPIGIIKKIG